MKADEMYAKMHDSDNSDRIFLVYKTEKCSDAEYLANSLNREQRREDFTALNDLVLYVDNNPMPGVFDWITNKLRELVENMGGDFQRIYLKPPLIRVAVDDNGGNRFWPYDESAEDLLLFELPPVQGMHLITGGKVPMEYGICDPFDKRTHNYEMIILAEPKGSRTSITLTRL